MSKNRLFQVLFSLAVIAALALAVAPAPAYALAASAANPALGGTAIQQISAIGLPPSAVVCRVVSVRHNGHVVRVWHCHRLTKSV